MSSDVQRLPSYGIYISLLVGFARCCTSVLDFHSKNLQITSKLLTQGYRYHKLRKTFGKFFKSYSELLLKYGDISFKEYLSKGISHPVFYGDLVYKLMRVKAWVWHANRGRLLLPTPGPVPFGICKCSLVETTNTQSYITPVYDIFPWCDFLPTLTLLLNIGFHRAFATGVACRQVTLTPPDTWSCPTLGLACVLMSRPISPELVLFPDF